MSNDLEALESLWPPGALRRKRTYHTGWSPPSKKETPMTRDQFPGEAEAIAQERADKAANDKIEALTTPLTDEQQLALAEADRLEQSWRRRHGLEPATGSLFRSSREIVRDGKAADWPQHLRQEYIDALDREDAARKASTTYRGAA